MRLHALGLSLRPALSLLLFAALPVAAQPLVMEPLRIEAPRWEADWLEAPAAVSTVDLERTEQGAQGLAIDEALNRLPGVFVQNRYNFSQGERLSIRGFGARAGFGIRGVRVLLDGMPLTLPDGQTELDGLDLGLADRIELIRGPASALYGNGAGGVVLISTPVPEQTYADATLSAGSFGFRSLRLEGGGSVGDWSYLAAVNRMEIDGYRDHSGAEESNFYGKAVRRLDNGDLTFLLSLSEGDREDPGGLTIEQVRADREQARPESLVFNSGEEATQSRAAVMLRRQLTADSEYRLRVFAGHRDFANRLPFDNGGQVAFDRLLGGLGAQYLRHGELAGRPNRFTVGADFEFQRDDRRNYVNAAGRRGARTLDQLEKVSSLGLFAENELALAERWTLTVAGRFDEVRLEVDDDFLAYGRDDSGDRTLDEWSYLGGLSYALAPRHRLYANIGSSFETPTTNELANPAGVGFYPDLDPQQAVNRELGVKGEWQRLRYEVTAFSIRLRDELVPYSLEEQPGRNFFRNAGRSRREGIELSLGWQLSPDWQLNGAYTYAEYEFKRFRQGGEVFDGNTIPGLPRETLFLEAALNTPTHFASLQFRHVGKLYADDANTTSVDAFNLVDLRGGLRLPLGPLRGEIYAGINNLTDEEYFANVRINDFGRRYYEPAPGRNYYAGLTLRY